jgi:hypothetical protein
MPNLIAFRSWDVTMEQLSSLCFYFMHFLSSNRENRTWVGGGGFHNDDFQDCRSLGYASIKSVMQWYFGAIFRLYLQNAIMGSVYYICTLYVSIPQPTTQPHIPDRLTDKLTDWLHRPHSIWEADCSSASQEIPSILWNSILHNCVPKTPSLVSILSQINPVHSPFYIQNTHFLIILPSMRRSTRCLLPSGLHPPQKKKSIHLSSSSVRISFPAHHIHIDLITRKIFGEE